MYMYYRYVIKAFLHRVAGCKIPKFPHSGNFPRERKKRRRGERKDERERSRNLQCYITNQNVTYIYIYIYMYTSLTSIISTLLRSSRNKLVKMRSVWADGWTCTRGYHVKETIFAGT